MFYKFFIIYIPNTTMENIMKTWKKWFKNYKNKSIEDFASFINRTGIGDMDLDTYCKYRFFVENNEQRLVDSYDDYKKDNNGKGRIENEEFFRLSVFAHFEKENETNNSEQGIA